MLQFSMEWRRNWQQLFSIQFEHLKVMTKPSTDMKCTIWHLPGKVYGLLLRLPGWKLQPSDMQSTIWQVMDNLTLVDQNHVWIWILLAEMNNLNGNWQSDTCQSRLCDVTILSLAGRFVQHEIYNLAGNRQLDICQSKTIRWSSCALIG